MKKRLSLLAAAFVGLFTEANATTYYSAPDATGNGSSYETPGAFYTLVNKLQAGDILYVRGGIYNYSSSLNIKPAGTKENPIKILACEGETPIFDFRKIAYGQRGFIFKNTTQYVHLKGVTIRYTGKNGLLNEGSHNTFEQLDVYGNGDTGIQMKGTGGHNMIINCDSHDNFDYKLGDITKADFGGNADGFADKQYTGPGNTYIGCRAWNNSDDGWDFFQRITSDDVPTVFENCVCFANGPKEYDMRNHGRYETDKDWFDQFASGLTITDDDGKTIENVTLEHYVNLGNGNGFKIGGDSKVHDVELYNCLAVGNKVKGFDQNNDFGSMTVINCTAYSNGIDYGFTNKNGGSLIIKNCISLGSKSKNSISAKSVTQKNNSWNLTGIACNDQDFQSLDTTVITKARQKDGSLPQWTLLLLVEKSDLIDAGVDVGRAYNDDAPDLGYREYTKTTGIKHIDASTLDLKIENGMITASDDVKTIETYDITGKRVTVTRASQLETSSLKSGIYIVVLHTKNSLATRKIQIAH